MEKFLLSAFTDEYNKDMAAQIALCREQQIPYLEPRFVGSKNIADLSVQEAKELRKKLENIGVSAIGSPLGKISLADDFEAHLEKAKNVFEIAGILDTGNVRMFSFYLHEGKSRRECRSEVIEKLGRLLDLADTFGLTLCHENEADIYGESPDMCLDLLKVFDGRMKCVFDMGNFVLGGFLPLEDAYPKLKNYIRYFHIKDALSAGAVVPPGCGEGHIKEILTDYRTEVKRDVLITLEPHLQTFDGLNALTGRSFENPYKYETQETAFLDALARLREMLE